MDLIIAIVCVCVCIILAAFAYRVDRSRTYVHLKTGNLYKVERFGKIKSPETGEWVECVIYHGITKPGAYARERTSFFESFQQISEYEKTRKKQ